MISSTRSLSSSNRTTLRLPTTCSSPPGLAFSSPTAAATSPERTVVSAHCGSVSAVDATYLGRAFNAAATALESAPAVLIRPAEALHHAVDRDVRGGRQFHGRRFLLVGWSSFGTTGPPHRTHRPWHGPCCSSCCAFSEHGPYVGD